MVKILTVLVTTISSSRVFAEKIVSSFCKCKCKSYSHFSAKILAYMPYLIIYAIFNNQSFNDMLTNDIVSFEQLGPGFWLFDMPY